MISIDNVQNLLNLTPHPTHQYTNIVNLTMSFLSNPPSVLETLNDNEFQEICNIIQQCSNLQLLDLQGINLGVLESKSRLQPLFQAISKCKNLKFLDLSQLLTDNLHPPCFQAISNIIIQLSNLISLALDWIPFYQLEFTNLQILCNLISNLPNLQILSLIGTHFNQLDTLSFQVLCDSIQKCRKLETLEFLQIDLDNLTSEHFNKLCKAIANSPFLVNCNFKFMQDNFSRERYETINTIIQKKQILLELAGEKGPTSLIYMAAKIVAESSLSLKALPAELQEELEKYRATDFSNSHKKRKL